jgi:hypothetical protein
VWEHTSFRRDPVHGFSGRVWPPWSRSTAPAAPLKP